MSNQRTNKAIRAVQEHLRSQGYVFQRMSRSRDQLWVRLDEDGRMVSRLNLGTDGRSRSVANMRGMVEREMKRLGAQRLPRSK